MSEEQEARGPAATPADFAARNAPSGVNEGDGAGGMVSNVAGNVKEKASEFAEEQKAAGAERIGHLGEAIHGAADAIGKEIPGAAGYIHSAAEQLERTSEKLRNSSVDDLLSRVGSFARKQPAAAFAGSVVAGFALSRFLKSSSR